MTTLRLALRSDQSRTRRTNRGTRMPTAVATSGKRSCSQLTTRRDASAANADSMGGSVMATIVARRWFIIANIALR